jgi:threonine dehydratase
MNVLCVNDDETRAAQQLIRDTLKQIVEPSCATVLAAVLRYPELFAGKRVGLILTGGNVTQ